ncbi:Nitrilase [Haplosporangium bisporale]|nr:Nitrilase [Haplosporangium bisporale]
MATRIAVAQFCAGQSVATNLTTCIRLMSQACKESAKIVDPWGKVLAECDGHSEGIAVAFVDLASLTRIRAEMPVLEHRRYDIFP